MLENEVFKHHEVLTIRVCTFMQVGSRDHIDVILTRKRSKVQVFWKIFKVLSTVKFYGLETVERKGGEREREEEAKVLFMIMIMQVACFLGFFLLIKLEVK